MKNLARMGLGMALAGAFAVQPWVGASAQDPCPPGFTLVDETADEYICKKIDLGGAVAVGDGEEQGEAPPADPVGRATRADSEELVTEEDAFLEEPEPAAPIREPLDLAEAAAAVEAGLAAYGARDYSAAAEAWKPLAERGYGPAQRLLGRLYFDGTGVRSNRVQAFFWWTVAAEKGDQEAESLLDQVALRRLGDALTVARSLAETWTPEP